MLHRDILTNKRVNSTVYVPRAEYLHVVQFLVGVCILLLGCHVQGSCVLCALALPSVPRTHPPYANRMQTPPHKTGQ